MRRSHRLLLVGVIAVGVMSPLARDPHDDSFPLSTYPMFAANRGNEHWIPTVVEVRVGGGTTRLTPELIAGTDEVVLASVTVERAVRNGQAEDLCREVAGRLGSGRYARVQSERHDVVDLVANGAMPLAVEVHAECTGG